jgi:hypothetical protein
MSSQINYDYHHLYLFINATIAATNKTIADSIIAHTQKDNSISPGKK